MTRGAKRSDVCRWSIVTMAIAVSALAAAAPPEPVPPPAPTAGRVIDRADDNGDALLVQWKTDVDENAIAGFRISVAPVHPEAHAEASAEPIVAEAAPSERSTVIEGLIPGVEYRVSLSAVTDEGLTSRVIVLPTAAPQRNWIDTRRIWLAILLGVVCAAVLGYIAAARRGISLWVRPIAGLEAVTDAVGRAVEMGRSVLFVPGIQDINDIQTVAGVTVLSRVARIAAEYDAEIKVPTARSLVMATCRETVEASFLAAGRPDAFRADDIYYLTDEQFGYVAGVTGQMVREEPAACFYMGSFYAESLILAETGNAIGAIQLAGTAQPSQLPFFIAACDYTLIGEEFFAASAYLSGEPQQLGSLKGQDIGKLLCGVLILGGCLLAPIAWQTGLDSTTQKASGAVAACEYLHDNVLGDDGFWRTDGSQADAAR